MQWTNWYSDLQPVGHTIYPAKDQRMIQDIMELDDGKIETGTPNQFDGKKPWFPVKIFPSTHPLRIGTT